MLNDTYIQQVANTYGHGVATTVSDAIEKAEDFLRYEEDYETASTEIEHDLIQWGTSEKVIRFSLIAVHAVYQGWDDTFDFFLGRGDFALATDGQAELIRWVEDGNWL